MTQPRDIIIKHGGPARMAELTGHTAQAVRLWKHRNRFPRTVWPELQAIGIKLEELRKMERQGRK